MKKPIHRDWLFHLLARPTGSELPNREGYVAVGGSTKTVGNSFRTSSIKLMLDGCNAVAAMGKDDSGLIALNVQSKRTNARDEGWTA
jgi:hypothetical protein